MKVRDDLLQAIQAWAETRSDIDIVVLTGSLTRDDGRVDELSDIDIELIGRGFTALQNSDDWLAEIAPLTMVLKLDPSQDQRWPTRLAIYKSGVKVDYTLAGEDRIQEMRDQSQLDETYRRGYRVLIDKTGLAEDLPDPIGIAAPVQAPTQKDFQTAVEIFFFEASHIPKYLARHDLWPAKLRDQTLKKYCLKMMVWHAATRPVRQPDIWHNGHHMQDWLAPDQYQNLNEIFAPFDIAGSVKALRAQVNLFRQLAREVADQTDLIYPQTVDDEISAMINKTIADHLTGQD